MSFLRAVAVGAGYLLALVFLAAQIAFWTGTSIGIVREHCLDPASTTTLEVDSHWTYILFPPATFANVDPAGRCVRNSPLREALDQLGIWDLATPPEQVADHIRTQLSEARGRP